MISTLRLNRSQIAQTGVIPGGARFLQESFPMGIKEIKEVITEGTAGKPVLRITGVFQKADDRNQNGRIYPYSILKEAVESIQPELANRSIVGEYDHPSDAKIHLERVSHLITKVWMEGKYVYGEAEIIEGTDLGRNLAAILRAKVKIGISSRGVGDMECVNEGKEDESYIVQNGYKFITWDCVAEPSVSEAVMSVMESKNYKLKEGIMTRSKMRKLHPEYMLVQEIKQHLKS